MSRMGGGVICEIEGRTKNQKYKDIKISLYEVGEGGQRGFQPLFTKGRYSFLNQRLAAQP